MKREDINEEELIGKHPSEVPKIEQGLYCNAKKVARTGDNTAEFIGYCDEVVGRNTGRCGAHRGGSNKNAGAPEGNQNAMRHGLSSDPDNLLEHLRKNEEHAYAWIQDKFESYIDVASFDRDSAWADQLMQVCVQEYTIWRAEGIQVREGVVVKTHKVSDQGVVEVDDENPANKPLDRMQRTVVKRLEKLGVMPSPDQQEADAVTDLKEQMLESARSYTEDQHK
jgi:hypothetical protein